MKLKAASRFFDTCPVYDAYTGTLLFKLQTSTFLESSVEGSTASRRTISVDPSKTFPAHACILALEQIWIVGANNPDEWAGEAIRKAYWTKRVTDNFKLLTPGEAALGAVGTPVYGSRKFLRDQLNGGTDAELDPAWDISLAASVTADRGWFLKSANTLFRVRMVYDDVDGFLTCQSDEVDEVVRHVAFTTSAVYDPVTDSNAPGYTSTTAVILDYAKTYVKVSATDAKPEVGDLSMVIAKQSLVPSVGQEVTVSEGRYKGCWRVLNVYSEHDSWKLQIRKA